MIAAGADIIDVGGESTRPGAEPVPHDLEIARVVPVVEALRADAVVSIDTRHAAVAHAAVAAGATIINDVSASLEQVAADTGAGWVAMHMRGTPQSMQENPTYDDVVADVLAYVTEAGLRGRAAGVEKIWVDPGIGFGKTTAHNLALLQALDQFVAGEFPVLLGVSRKRFIGVTHADADAGGVHLAPRTVVSEVPETARPASDRLEGSLAVATWAILQKVAILRVHDVAETVRCASVVER